MRQAFLDNPNPWTASRYLVEILEHDLPVPEELKPWVGQMLTSYTEANRRAVQTGIADQLREQTVATIVAMHRVNGTSYNEGIRIMAKQLNKSESTVKDWFFRTNTDDKEFFEMLSIVFK